LAVFLILVYILGCSGGRDLGVETPVPDGTIVLVKKGDALGAFVLKNQVLDSNEAAEYTWYYRTDGQATFLSDEAHLFQQGEGKTSEVRRSDRPFTHIEFGPFLIGWSGKRKGEGWIYYERFAGEAVAPGDLLICVTDETDIEKINAKEGRWIYKGSPTDPGITLAAGP